MKKQCLAAETSETFLGGKSETLLKLNFKNKNYFFILRSYLKLIYKIFVTERLLKLANYLDARQSACSQIRKLVWLLITLGGNLVKVIKLKLCG